ncbi:DUF262 domain-containing protein [Agrococcus terreus]|uniref:DUF262 domain-containing protein n=1 Tax=Agrococcus terreus TaxID=574649 RepID=A0ABQ2KQ53_9MICO|nr:DUF262 domain-containing protein [Agrococcus terreus]GGN89338.1 hypothetical protein GCM10010968_25890 [Agrococcus terreus]
MQPFNAVIEKLLGSPIEYQIPSFQRPYSWGKEQLDVLWLDLLEQYRLALPNWERRIGDDFADRVEHLPRHYMGTLVLKPGPEARPQRVAVIDGQQRLTTIVLMLAVLRDRVVAGAADLTEREAEWERLSYDYLLNQRSSASPLRLSSLDADAIALEAILKNKTGQPVSATQIGLDGRRRYPVLNAYRYFHAEYARSRVNPGTPQLETYADLFPIDLGLLEAVITTRLKFIEIRVDNNDDANAIFASLNAKGLGLSQLQLVKNLIFMVGRDEESRVQQKWKQISDLVEDEKSQNLLLWADIVSRGKTILQSKTYEEIQRQLSTAGNDAAAVENYLDQLRSRAQVFGRLLRPELISDLELRSAVQRVLRAGNVTPYAILLYILVELDAGRADRQQVLAALAHVESYLVRRFLADKSPQNLTTQFATAIGRAIGADGTLESRVATALGAQPENWPNDSVIMAIGPRVDFYHNQKVAQRMLVLERLDHFLDPSSQLNYELTDRSIEHVLPQAQVASWSASLAEIGDSLEEVHRDLLHTIGNLTVVTPDENSRLGVLLMPEKSALYQNSAYPLTRELANHFEWQEVEGYWGSTGIRARSEELLSRACSLWPRPASSPFKSLENVETDASDEGERTEGFAGVPDEEVQGETAF